MVVNDWFCEFDSAMAGYRHIFGHLVNLTIYVKKPKIEDKNLQNFFLGQNQTFPLTVQIWFFICLLVHSKFQVVHFMLLLFPVGVKVVSEFYRAWKSPFESFQTVFWAFQKRPGHILKTLRFLSLRYSADFRRSGLAFFLFSSDHRAHPVCTTFWCSG